jgi:hypothetical protein
VTSAGSDLPHPEEVELVEEGLFLANLDYYLDAAEAGQEFWLVRDDMAICFLGPAMR